MSSGAPSTVAGPTPRSDFFQTPQHLMVSLYLKGYAGQPVHVDYHTHRVDVTLPPIPGTDAYSFTLGPLAGAIIPGECTERVLGTKIELKLPKDQPGITWPALFATSPVDLTAARQYASPRTEEAPLPELPSPLTARRPRSPPAAAPATSASLANATGSRLSNGSGVGMGVGGAAGVDDQAGPSSKKKNWDAVVSSLSDDEEENNGAGNAAGGGDAALQKLFAGIYANADADTKRAMIKSFTESGGTTLSTDWSSVGKDKVPVRPPDGMYEMKM